MLSRRQLIKQLASCSSMAPFMLSALTRPAWAASNVKRVVFFYIPDGCIPSLWHPTGSETDFMLSPMLSPLDSIKQDCIFLKGINMYEGGFTHEGGIAKVLTGNAKQSIDTLIGDYYRNQTAHASLYLGVTANYQNAGNVTSYLSSGTAQRPDDNPLNVFNRLFDDEQTAQDPRLSILDAAVQDINRTRHALGQDEAIKLDQHLTSLREIEQRLKQSSVGQCDTSGFNSQGFTLTRTDYFAEYNDEKYFPTVGQLQMDIIKLAFSCDKTRVINLQWQSPVSPIGLDLPNVTQNHHDSSHYGSPDSTAAANFVIWKQWYMQQLLYLTEQLRNTPDGDGNLLDSTLIFVHSELGDGSAHDHNNMPFMLIGGNQFQKGRFLSYNNASHNGLLVSIANYMGLNLEQYGNDARENGLGGLAGL